MRHRNTVGQWVRVLVAVFVTGGLTLLVPAPARAGLTFVNTTADTTAACSMAGVVCLREAIAAAKPGDILIIATGVTGTITLGRGTMVVLNPVTILGPGSALLTVNADNAVRVFSVPAAGSSAIIGLTITGGNSSDGGGLYVGGAMTLTDVTVRGNTASGAAPHGRGGGIFVDTAATLVVDSSTIGGPNVSDGNKATNGSGGGIFLFDNAGLTMRNGSVVRGNTAGNQGGGICISPLISGTNSSTITGSTIAGNTASDFGGGISVAGPLTLDSSTIGGPNAGDGNKSTNGSGGGIFVNGGGALRTVQNGSVIRGNTASSNGGGIFATAPTTIMGSTVAGNSAGMVGGGISTFYRPAIIIDASTIGGPDTADANTAPNGGGIYIDDTGPLTVRNGAVVRGNRATGGNGGGIFVTGPATITGSTMTGNSATSTGGGILASGVLTMVNATASGNSSPFGGSGIRASGTATIVAATLTRNTGSPALIASGGAAHTLTGSIVAGNSGGDGLDIFTDGGGNVLSGNPLLAPLGVYGGAISVLTHALLPGSPALDTQTRCPTDPTTGIAMPLATDARGVGRPQGAGCDSGAFESQGFTSISPTGNGQSATVTAAFAPLGLTVIGATGEPVTGGTVTFTIMPVSGAGGTFNAADMTGCAVSGDNLSATCLIEDDGASTTPPLKAGLVTGSFTVVASTAGIPVGENISFTLTNTTSAGMITPQPMPKPIGTVMSGMPPAVQPTPKMPGGTDPATPNPQPARATDPTMPNFHPARATNPATPNPQPARR